MVSTLAFLIGLFPVVFLWTLKRRSRKALPLPPGPKPLPLVGNLFDMPTTNIAPALRDLSQKHGDIVHLDFMGQPFIVIGSYDAAVALLETQSAKTSDRPRLVMAEIIGFTWALTLQRYSQLWRQTRRTFHEFFNLGAITPYRTTHLQQTRKFLKNLLDKPEDFLFHARGAVGGSILGVVYGFEATDGNDEYIVTAEKGSSIFSEIAVPGRYLVELFPVLSNLPAWFPGASFKKDAAIWGKYVHAARNFAYDAAVQLLADGLVRPSVVSTLVEEAVQEHGRVTPDDEEHFKNVTSVAYVAGADTTVTTLDVFFLAMVTHPDVQRKAQAEVDTVIGTGRLPSFNDREHLPYVNAVLKECLRWHSMVPLGIFHRAVDDLEYKGYLIPNGSILVANAWAMSRDPTVYPEPETFRPERFLKDGKPDTYVRDPASFQFGFGRRVCPGRYFSDEILFIITASVLQVFNIQPPLDEHGEPTLVEPKFPMDSCLSHPEPFGCRITPRSDTATMLVRQSL